MILSLQALVAVNLLGLHQMEPATGLPPGWKVRSVSGVERPVAAIVTDGDDRLFRLSGAGQAAWFYRPIETPLPPGGLLHWSWRVVTAPNGASLAVRDRDDSPIRIYVVFGKPGGLLKRSGRVLFYSFGGAEAAGYTAPSHVNKRLHVIGVDGPDAVGAWREHRVDPVADYRRIWNRDPEPITAIGVMQDTDQTKHPAIAEIRTLEWKEGSQ